MARLEATVSRSGRLEMLRRWRTAARRNVEKRRGEQQRSRSPVAHRELVLRRRHHSEGETDTTYLLVPHTHFQK